MLCARLGPDRMDAEPSAVDDIVSRCAGLPHALVTVAAHAATQPDMAMREVAAQLRESQERLDAFADGDPDARTALSLIWIWQALADPSVARDA